MALNPDEIENSQFSSSLRGYDKQEVRSFLARIARTMRQAELVDREPVATALPRPAASEQSDEDRFGALGERIAALLRNAHDSAAQIKATAEADVAEIRAQAEAEVVEAQAQAEQARTEAAEIRSKAEADADEIRSVAEANGLARLEERRVEIESTELVIQQDQEMAMLELAEAREQVSVLLEQARAQSEFIRLEADDIIREKIRANLDAAEDRLNVLRNTEEVSRERIRLAQNELENALGRLEAEPAPALPHGDEHLIIEEAEGRAIEAGYVVGESAPVDQAGPDTAREFADGGAVTDGGAFEADLVEASVVEADVLDVNVVDAPGDGTNIQDAAEPVEADAAAADAQVTADTTDALSENSGAAQPAETQEEPAFGTAAHAEDEDALTKLVREAMQSAVETAQSGD